MQKPHPGLLPSPPPSSPHPTPRPSSPITLVLRRIRAYLVSDSFLNASADLSLSLDCTSYSTFLREWQTPHVLSGKDLDSLRYDYSPETAILRICAMPTPVHDAISGLASYTLNQMGRTGFLSDQEVECVEFDAGGDVALPTIRSLSREGSKGEGFGTAVKQPDAAYYFVDSDVKAGRFPRVVFEVAFSQSYASVIEDARHWLHRSEGFVKLVVVVKLFEGSHPEAEIDDEEVDKKTLEQRSGLGTNGKSPQDSPQNDGSIESHQDTNENQDDNQDTDDNQVTDNNQDQDNDTIERNPAPVNCSITSTTHSNSPETQSSTQDGNDTSPEPSTSSSHPSPTSSTAQDYQQWYDDDPTPWVGPITGFIELYRYNCTSKKIWRDGPRFDIATTTDLPQICITDLLPRSKITGDATRSFPIPLQRYRSALDRAVRKLASNRRASKKHEGRAKRGTEDHSGDYDGGAQKHGDGGPLRRSKRVRCGDVN